ncbi:hypothetical protein Tsubulata_015212 [Turnera subulata]|uniref:Uncharacterized protein n=1 Tax=Turnera subulata TaxID=218843 RepID=A0A9Q0J3P1_9ROSI|nr:hypothetical protein Tsubulata_015212 [Turnera subulata]
MGALVLNPRDCIQNPLPSPAPRMKFPRNPNPSRQNRAPQPNNQRRKRSPNTSPPSRAPASAAVSSSPPKNNYIMGQVKILKRGEQLAKAVPPVKEAKPKAPVTVRKDADLADLGSTDRLGPDPEMVTAQIRLSEPKQAGGFYAGSAFVTSPPPSSLPLPAFFTKKAVVVESKNDVATSDLCKLLGLSL